MSADLPLSSPAPRSSGLVVPSVAVAMPFPTPAPPAAAAENQKRPAPLLKRMKLLLARAVSWLFGGVKRTSCVALVGSLPVLLVVRALNFRARPEMSRSWLPFLWAWLFVLLDVACWNCVYYCLEYYEQWFEQSAEPGAALQLPPPPPEMDMC